MPNSDVEVTDPLKDLQREKRNDHLTSLTRWLETDRPDLHDEPLEEVLVPPEGVPREVNLLGVRSRMPGAEYVGFEAGLSGAGYVFHPEILG